jgi:hypothetical protein
MNCQTLPETSLKIITRKSTVVPKLPEHSYRFIGGFDDIFQFNTATLEWIDLSEYTTGATPYARDSHGVAHCAGRLYVFGGFYGPGESLSVM